MWRIRYFLSFQNNYLAWKEWHIASWQCYCLCHTPSIAKHPCLLKYKYKILPWNNDIFLCEYACPFFPTLPEGRRDHFSTCGRHEYRTYRFFEWGPLSWGAYRSDNSLQYESMNRVTFQEDSSRSSYLVHLSYSYMHCCR